MHDLNELLQAGDSENFPSASLITNLSDESDSFAFKKYSQTDGLVKSVIRYKDAQKLDLLCRCDEFSGRKDGLRFRVRKEDRVIESFDPRLSNLRLFGVVLDSMYQRVYWKGRLDGLTEVTLYADSIAAKFNDRSDGKLCEKATFCEETSKFQIGMRYVRSLEVIFTDITISYETGRTEVNQTQAGVDSKRWEVLTSAAASLSDALISAKSQLARRRDFENSESILWEKSLHDRAFDIAQSVLKQDPESVRVEKTDIRDIFSALIQEPNLSSVEKESIKTAFAQRQIEKGKLIQQRLAEEQDRLRAKRASVIRTNDEKSENMKFQADALFKISVLEQRLARHEIEASSKFKELEGRLNAMKSKK